MKSEMSVSTFAERLGKSHQAISEAMKAGEVHKKLAAQAASLESLDYSVKREIGRAPEWMWPALVAQFTVRQWRIYRMIPSPPRG